MKSRANSISSLRHSAVEIGRAGVERRLEAPNSAWWARAGRGLRVPIKPVPISIVTSPNRDRHALFDIPTPGFTLLRLPRPVPHASAVALQPVHHHTARPTFTSACALTRSRLRAQTIPPRALPPLPTISSRCRSVVEQRRCSESWCFCAFALCASRDTPFYKVCDGSWLTGIQQW